MRIAGHGLAIDLPAGWEGRIFRRGGAGPVMHIATFPLLPTDGDYGAAATGRLGNGDTFAALLEFVDSEKIRPGVGLFELLGPPVPRVQEFGPMQLQVTRAGQLGWQRFFTAERRTFALYAVLAPGGRPAARMVHALAAVLATLELAA